MLNGKHFVRGALITVSIILFNQGLIQFWLYQKRENSMIINVAGRQRMLSQRIDLELYKAYNSKVNMELIENLYRQWRTTHYAFINPNNELGIASEEIRIALEGLSKNIEVIKPYIGITSLSDKEMNMINNNQVFFLKQMEVIVNIDGSSLST